MKCLHNFTIKEFLNFCEENNINQWKIHETPKYINEAKLFLETNIGKKFYQTRLYNDLKYSKGTEVISWINSYKFFYDLIKDITIRNKEILNANIIIEYTIPNTNIRADIIIAYKNKIIIYELSYFNKYSKSRETIKINQLQNYCKEIKENGFKALMKGSLIILNENTLTQVKTLEKQKLIDYFFNDNISAINELERLSFY